MSYSHERDEFIVQASKAGLSLDTIRLLLRNATTLQRCAEAQCNGDWPYDNGERKVIPCAACEAGCMRSSLKRCAELETPELVAALPQGYTPVFCPDCRASARVKALLELTPFQAEFNGDPRGAVLRLHPKTASQDEIHSGQSRGLYVPAGHR